MGVPCIDCLILPICRHKYFIDMKNECEMIDKFLFKSEVDSNHVFSLRRFDFDPRVYLISEIVKPVNWDAKSITTRVTEIARGKKYYANRRQRN